MASTKNIVLAIVVVFVAIVAVGALLSGSDKPVDSTDPSVPDEPVAPLEAPSTDIIASFASDYVYALFYKDPQTMDGAYYSEKYSLGYLDGGNYTDGWTAHAQVGTYIIGANNYKDALFVYYELSFMVTPSMELGYKYHFEVINSSEDHWTTSDVNLNYTKEAKAILEVALKGAGISGPYTYSGVNDNKYRSSYGGIAHGVIGNVTAGGNTMEFYFLMGYVDGEFVYGEFRLNGDTIVESTTTSALIMSSGQW